MSNLLDIDYLKGMDVVPQWFGLGFIQLKLDSRQRMHFWHPDLLPDDPAFENEYHDHRYDFHSRVLVGSITNHIATVEPDFAGPYDLFEVCCSGGGQKRIGSVAIYEIGSFVMNAGASYNMNGETFHKVSAHQCVTVQTREPSKKEKARVVQQAKYPSKNPFSSHIDQNILWDHIADLIEEKEEKPGYHLRRIEKGILGQTSKIREELNELEDAIAQGSKVMELVELSDIVGAIRAYLEENHPAITLNDLMTFDDITARAFRNGRR